MLDGLHLLGTVLDIGTYSAAILKESEDPSTKCLKILSEWLKRTPDPTWIAFCNKLKMHKQFNHLRSNIMHDKNL